MWGFVCIAAWHVRMRLVREFHALLGKLSQLIEIDRTDIKEFQLVLTNTANVACLVSSESLSSPHQKLANWLSAQTEQIKRSQTALLWWSIWALA
jgi:hypothetical protein